MRYHLQNCSTQEDLLIFRSLIYEAYPSQLSVPVSFKFLLLLLLFLPLFKRQSNKCLPVELNLWVIYIFIKMKHFENPSKLNNFHYYGFALFFVVIMQPWNRVFVELLAMCYRLVFYSFICLCPFICALFPLIYLFIYMFYLFTFVLLFIMYLTLLLLWFLYFLYLFITYIFYVFALFIYLLFIFIYLLSLLIYLHIYLFCLFYFIIHLLIFVTNTLNYNLLNKFIFKHIFLFKTKIRTTLNIKLIFLNQYSTDILCWYFLI